MPRTGPVAALPVADQAVLEVMATMLADRRAPRVAVMARDGMSDLGDVLGRARPGVRTRVVDAALEGSELHVALLAAGPLDLLVDRSGHPAWSKRVSRLIGYLQPGGALVGGLGPAQREMAADQRDAYATGLVQATDESVQVTVADAHVVVVSGEPHRPVVREKEVVPLLERRPDLGRVLELRPARRVHARGTVTMSEPDPIQTSLDSWVTPELALREWNEVDCAPGGVVTLDGWVLPETFRHSFRPRPGNQWLTAGPVGMFAGPPAAPPRRAEPPPADGVRWLPGSYFHLDNELRGHFGHTTTEVLAKVWGWQVAKQRDPELKALVSANRRAEPAEWELTLLEAAGIAREDLVFTRAPVRVERLIGATPMFGNPRFAHPDLVALWQQIADRLEPAGSIDVPDRIFVSRRSVRGRRACLNGAETDAFFAGLGYTVVYPEDYALPDQVRLFRRASQIAGLAGSGMFGLMWADRPKPVTMVTPDRYPARNEFLISGLRGHHLAVAWSRAEPRDPETGEWIRGVDAPFIFDVEREGAFVRRMSADPRDPESQVGR